MDWIHENRLKTILIIGLLAVNIALVVLMWWKMPHESGAQATEEPKRTSGSAGLMKQVLGLSDAQTQKIDAVLRTRREEARPYADSLAALKLRLAEELFLDPPDTVRARGLTTEIGKAQAAVEMNRYRNFREIVTVLSPEQRVAFKPVVVELFGRKPPREDGLTEPGRGSGRRGDRQADGPGGGRARATAPQGRSDSTSDRVPPRPADEPPPPADGKAGPPSVEEKLDRYIERLGLTDTQARSVEKILRASREKGKALRDMRDPDRATVDVAKEQIRKEEDEQIMQILTDQQKREFSAMRARKPR